MEYAVGAVTLDIGTQLIARTIRYADEGADVLKTVRDRLAGRPAQRDEEPAALDKKIVSTVAEKTVGKNPYTATALDLFFGNNRVGAPDPSGTFRPVAVDAEGNFVFDDSPAVVQKVVMLPMWNADP